MKVFIWFIGAVVLSLFLNQLSSIWDGPSLTDLWTRFGNYASYLQRDDIGDQMVALTFTWISIIVLLAIVGLAIKLWNTTRLLEHEKRERTNTEPKISQLHQECKEMRNQLEDSDIRAHELKKSVEGYEEAFQNLTALVSATIEQLSVTSRETTAVGRNVQFEELCNLLAYSLMSDLYNGQQKGKVTFVHFGGTAFVYGLRPKQAKELTQMIMDLRIVQNALSTDQPMYLDNVHLSPYMVSTQETNWSPKHCSSIMVAPIGYGEHKGVFGVYAETSDFFAEKQDDNIPKFIRHVLEIAFALISNVEASVDRAVVAKV